MRQDQTASPINDRSLELSVYNFWLSKYTHGQEMTADTQTRVNYLQSLKLNINQYQRFIQSGFNPLAKRQNIKAVYISLEININKPFIIIVKGMM
jgi:hypothetical protein